MKVTFLRATTEDKLILQGILYEPERNTDKIIVHIHGMGGNFYENQFLDVMAQTFTSKGWAFLSFNTRGHDIVADFPIAGEKEECKRIGNSREVFEECILDIKSWIDLVEEKGFRNIVLQGHSLGSVKAVYYLSQLKDKRISKLILASPPDMVGLAEAEENHQEILSQSNEMISEGRGDRLLPGLLWDWYYLSAKTYSDFGTRGNSIDIFNTYDEEAASILANIEIPTLAFFGSTDDAAILPISEALEVIKKKAKSCPNFDTAIIEGAPHSYFGHEQDVSSLIVDWLDNPKSSQFNLLIKN